ncbi:MAG: acyl-CoA thioesterase [Thalassovita sp.]
MPKQPRDTRSDYADFYPLQTRWMDNDIYGHMNNVVHYSLFDTAVNGWLIDKGLLDPQTSPVIGLVVETGCQYFAEMRFPDKITAGIRIAKLGNSSVTYQVGLFRGDEDAASAMGHFTHVYVDRETRRPAPIEAERRVVLSQLLRDQS